MARKKKARTGRPPRHEGEQLSKNRTFRVRGELDEKLIAAAEKSGRSVSEEIEYRLERSFTNDQTAEVIEKTAAVVAKYSITGPVEDLFAAGVTCDRLLKLFPWWMLLPWTHRHPDNPEVERLRTQLLAQFGITPEEMERAHAAAEADYDSGVPPWDRPFGEAKQQRKGQKKAQEGKS